jgi:peptide/nickel transport system permease protein
MTDPKKKNKSARALKRLSRNPLAVSGVLIVFVFLICMIFAPLLAPHSATRLDLGAKLVGPTSEHWFGTDEFGRDVLSRIIWGTRVSMSVAFITVGVSMVLGVIMGLLAGYFGGWLDNLIMRATDVLLCFPILLMALGLVAVLGPQLMNIMLAVAVALTPQYARIIRGVTIPLRNQQYVEASRGLGANSFYILVKHVFPNVVPSIIVVATLNVATAILIESSLSFLGLGVQPPTPSWGAMIADGRKWLTEAPWISTFSGVAIMFAVLGFNLFGDALRDILDPRLRGSDGDLKVARPLK